LRQRSLKLRYDNHALTNIDIVVDQTISVTIERGCAVASRDGGAERETLLGLDNVSTAL